MNRLEMAELENDLQEWIADQELLLELSLKWRDDIYWEISNKHAEMQAETECLK